MALTLFSVLVGLAGPASADYITHQMEVALEPGTGGIEVTDRIHLGSPPGDEPVELLLNAALEIESASPPLEKVPLGEFDGFFGINGASIELDTDLELARYRLTEYPEDGLLTISYEGNMNFGLSDQKEEYTRGFRETAGIVGEEGVYLAASGFWYPYFGEDLIEFEVAVEQPEDWHVISQGNGTSRGEDGRAVWASGGPMDEIYLVGGPLVAYSEAAGAVEAQVFLHEVDDALADKYLKATAQYVEMYRELIGPYPYEKFALVENFWETGYGMPSFTLLGPQVIRFPFILTSSYPHEILHNWWGNSVFVDYATGNWCEGLTAYMADHLIQEQRGKGEDYRRATLQKYRNYVKESRDFPLKDFRSRHSAAREAVGYGKTLMGYHMLRLHVGDDAFRRTMARFYREFRNKRASFRDLQATFEAETGEDLSWFFDAWVERPGAAALEIEVQEVQEADGGYLITGSLVQGQQAEFFELEIPVAVLTENGADLAMVRTTGKETSFSLQADSRPLAIQADPQFDVFRLLDAREIPPSIGQIFGEPEILAVLPSAESDAVLAAYRELVEGWQSDSHSIEVVMDSDLDSPPADRSFWILGRENLLADRLFATDLEGVEVTREQLGLGVETVSWSDHSMVVVRRHPALLDKAVGWLVVEPRAAFAGVGRKLPHYGKYSYLAFEGEEPTNVVKGQWPTSDSPLLVDLRPEGEARLAALPAMQFAERQALADLPPVFSQSRLMEHVELLAAPEYEGRGVGTAGLDKAAQYLVGQFEQAGLEPGGDNGTYLQRFTMKEGPEGAPVDVANVIGVLPGAKQEWEDQAVIVGAHFDHLGWGWPDVHSGDEGQVHPGADDNASGVAVLVELAKTLAEGEAPQRSLIFVGFTGEEAGRAGSKYYVANPIPVPLAGIRAVVNIDTVGRLGDGAVSILGTGTADEWQHIFRGASYVTGVDSRNIPESAEASDQMSFIEKGIPGVQIFTQAHGDYHRPGDTADKVDGAGLVKVATLAKEAVVYLGGREEPLTVKIEGQSAGPPTGPSAGGPSGGRRVRFGTVPDFAFQGPGVRVSEVSEGSPAEKAGFMAGDTLLSIDGQEVTDLRTYSQILRTLEPGQTVEAGVMREGEEVVLQVTVEER
jgi:hypothetical protein